MTFINLVLKDGPLVQYEHPLKNFTDVLESQLRSWWLINLIKQMFCNIKYH